MVSFSEIDGIVFLRLMGSFFAFDGIGPVLGFAFVEYLGTLKIGPTPSNDINDTVGAGLNGDFSHRNRYLTGGFWALHLCPILGLVLGLGL